MQVHKLRNITPDSLTVLQSLQPVPILSNVCTSYANLFYPWVVSEGSVPGSFAALEILLIQFWFFRHLV